MKMQAQAIQDAVTVKNTQEFEGNGWLEVDLDGIAHEAFERLPAGLEFQGRVYGKRAFNSDRMVAYYSTHTPIARQAR